MNNSLPPIFDLDRDINSTYGKQWIGCTPTRTPFKQTWTKDLVHFRHVLTTINAQPPLVLDNCTTIIIDQSHQVFDHIANLVVSFSYGSTINPVFMYIDSVFRYIGRLIVKFSETEVLNLTGSQLETVMKLHPEYYKKMILHNGAVVIPIQVLLMETQATVINHPITIKLQFANGFSVYNQMATFEGYRSTNESYRRTKMCAHEKHIYTYYFNEYKGACDYIIDTPVDVLIYGAIVTIKSKTLPDQQVNIKFGGVDMISCSNPYFEYNEIMIPIDKAYCYFSRSPSMNLPKLTSMTGLVMGHKDLKVEVTSDQPIDIEILYIINNAMLSQSGKVSLMVLIKYDELIREPTKGSPLYKINDHEFIEGYWADLSPIYDSTNSRNKYNLPIATDQPVDREFLKKLHDLVSDQTGKVSSECSMGMSCCRICNQINGCKEYQVSKDGISFRFPSGLMHYYEDHNVQPSDEFYQFIMNLS